MTLAATLLETPTGLTGGAGDIDIDSRLDDPLRTDELATAAGDPGGTNAPHPVFVAADAAVAAVGVEGEKPAGASCAGINPATGEQSATACTNTRRLESRVIVELSQSMLFTSSRGDTGAEGARAEI